MNNSETSFLIKITFHFEHHWGGGLTALGFGPDRISILVSMATDSSHRVIMGKILCCDHSSSFIFSWIFFILAGKKDTHKISHWFGIGQIGPLTIDLAAIERLEKSP